MEDLFGEFQVWLQAAGDSLEALRPFSVETEQRGKQLEQAMVGYPSNVVLRLPHVVTWRTIVSIYKGSTY